MTRRRVMWLILLTAQNFLVYCFPPGYETCWDRLNRGGTCGFSRGPS